MAHQTLLARCSGDRCPSCHLPAATLLRGLPPSCSECTESPPSLQPSPAASIFFFFFFWVHAARPLAPQCCVTVFCRPLDGGLRQAGPCRTFPTPSVEPFNQALPIDPPPPTKVAPFYLLSTAPALRHQIPPDATRQHRAAPLLTSAYYPPLTQPSSALYPRSRLPPCVCLCFSVFVCLIDPPPSNSFADCLLSPNMHDVSPPGRISEFF